MSTGASNKRRGAQFEIDVLKYVRSLGLPAERLRLAGRDDEGDVVVEDVGMRYILEMKAVQRANLTDFVRQAQVEAGNYAKHRGLDKEKVYGVVVLKKRGAPISEAFVVTTLAEFLSV